MANIDDLFTAQNDFATFVASITGMRTQLIDAGWSPEAAEQIVLASLTASLKMAAS